MKLLKKTSAKDSKYSVLDSGRVLSNVKLAARGLLNNSDKKNAGERIVAGKSNSRLIILRHRESVQNAKNICTGQLGGTLSKKGLRDAKKVGRRLSSYYIDVAYSSDLKRAIDTAKEIIKFHPGLKLKKDARIRERYFGKLQGKPFPKDLDWKNLPKCVESDKRIDLRASKFIKYLEPA